MFFSYYIMLHTLMASCDDVVPSELARHFENVKAGLTNCEGEIIWASESKDEASQASLRTRFVLRTGPQGMCAIRHFQGAEVAFLRNKKYVAKIMRTQPEQWRVTRIAFPEAPDFSSLDHEVASYRQLILGFFSGYGLRASVTLLDVFRGSQFAVTATQPAVLNSAKVITVHYSYTQPTTPQSEYFPYSSGTIYVTADGHNDLFGMDLHSSYADGGTGTASSRVVSTMALPNGIRVPAKITVSSEARSKTGTMIWKRIGETTASFRPVVFEDHDFTLSAFGLEEPHGVTWPKPTPYWLYGTIGSVAVIVLGILLMRWSQRRSARATA